MFPKGVNNATKHIEQFGREVRMRLLATFADLNEKVFFAGALCSFCRYRSRVNVKQKRQNIENKTTPNKD